MAKIHEQTMEKDTKYMRRYSTSLVIRDMQIKTTLWYHFLPIIVAKIQKLHFIFCQWGRGEARLSYVTGWSAKWFNPWRGI